MFVNISTNDRFYRQDMNSYISMWWYSQIYLWRKHAVEETKYILIVKITIKFLKNLHGLKFRDHFLSYVV